jgi:L-iditol 2-dehydrogenase
MNGTMKVAVMTGVSKMGWTERPIPAPEPGEALIKLEYVGVCGSDLHYYEAGGIGKNIVKPPFVLGHEAGGVVVETAPDVKNLKPGDRVALEPGIGCGHCEFCNTGRYHLCPEVIFFATPPIDGVFQEYVAHPASLCFKIADNMDTMEAALIEPLAVGFHAANRGEAHIGQTAVVFGSGCIGLMTMMALQAEGVSRIYMVDVIEKRLEKAKELGAAGIINAKKENVLEAAQDITAGAGFDLAVETAGTEVTSRQTVEVVKKGSNIVLVGYSASGEIALPMSLALDKELSLKGVFRYHHVYPMAIDAVASGKVKPKAVVTDVFDFDDIQNGMDKSIAHKADIVKSVIKIVK